MTRLDINRLWYKLKSIQLIFLYSSSSNISGSLSSWDRRNSFGLLSPISSFVFSPHFIVFYPLHTAISIGSSVFFPGVVESDTLLITLSSLPLSTFLSPQPFLCDLHCHGCHSYRSCRVFISDLIFPCCFTHPVIQLSIVISFTSCLITDLNSLSLENENSVNTSALFSP